MGNLVFVLIIIHELVHALLEEELLLAECRLQII